MALLISGCGAQNPVMGSTATTPASPNSATSQNLGNNLAYGQGQGYSGYGYGTGNASAYPTSNANSFYNNSNLSNGYGYIVFGDE